MKYGKPECLSLASILGLEKYFLVSLKTALENQQTNLKAYVQALLANDKLALKPHHSCSFICDFSDEAKRVYYHRHQVALKVTEISFPILPANNVELCNQ